MDIYKINDMGQLIQGNPYVGRGIVLGRSADGSKAVSAYFIMGRSQNSRNRVFTLRDGALFTEPFDASKVEDPSLIIYAALRMLDNKLIVTNGDQTDTIYDGLQAGMTFSQALSQRQFEPDAPQPDPPHQRHDHLRPGRLQLSDEHPQERRPVRLRLLPLHL